MRYACEIIATIITVCSVSLQPIIPMPACWCIAYLVTSMVCIQTHKVIMLKLILGEFIPTLLGTGRLYD